MTGQGASGGGGIEALEDQGRRHELQEGRGAGETGDAASREVGICSLAHGSHYQSSPSTS